MHDDRSMRLRPSCGLRSRRSHASRRSTTRAPRLAAEQRSSAVAIVDQKTPGMSGVELLVRLREAGDPATHMRAVLLTGYADLDAPVAAKNKACVDRFIEKPWMPGELLAALGALLADHFVSRGVTHYLFREVCAEQELTQLLKMRYEVYRLTSIGGVLPMDNVGMDADNHELVSRFYGLFESSVRASGLIGLRVSAKSQGRPSRHSGRSWRIKPRLLERLLQPRVHPLPMMKYLIDRGGGRSGGDHPGPG